MIAVRIGRDLRMAVVGAPSYFASRPKPKTPQDLTAHDCINMRLPTRGGLSVWRFEKRGRELNVRVEGPLVFNNIALRRDAVLAGFGLAYLPEDQVQHHLAQGRLVRVLDDWCPAVLRLSPLLPEPPPGDAGIRIAGGGVALSRRQMNCCAPSAIRPVARGVPGSRSVRHPPVPALRRGGRQVAEIRSGATHQKTCLPKRSAPRRNEWPGCAYTCHHQVMRIRMTRFLALASVAVSLAASVTAADAGTRHRQHARMGYSHVLTPAPQGPIWSGPNQCWTDEGYGRYASCSGRS